MTEPRRKLFLYLGCALLVLILSTCQNPYKHQFQELVQTEIETGKTTKEDIINLLGEPYEETYIMGWDRFIPEIRRILPTPAFIWEYAIKDNQGKKTGHSLFVLLTWEGLVSDWYMGKTSRRGQLVK